MPPARPIACCGRVCADCSHRYGPDSAGPGHISSKPVDTIGGSIMRAYPDAVDATDTVQEGTRCKDGGNPAEVGSDEGRRSQTRGVVQQIEVEKVVPEPPPPLRSAGECPAMRDPECTASPRARGPDGEHYPVEEGPRTGAATPRLHVGRVFRGSVRKRRGDSIASQDR